MCKSCPPAAMMRDAAGFFGKMRAQGDFVARRLPPEFIEPWDACMQHGMRRARDLLGAQWLPFYLSAPVWRFALGQGICGATAWAGVMMPGVDRVGRHFPLTIARAVADLAWLHDAHRWYDEAAELALSTLAEGVSLRRFDAALVRLSSTPSPCDSLFRLADGSSFADWLDACTTGGSGAWWLQPSDAQPGLALHVEGLPDDACFARLLEGTSAEASPIAGLCTLFANEQAGGIGNVQIGLR